MSDCDNVNNKRKGGHRNVLTKLLSKVGKTYKYVPERQTKLRRYLTMDNKEIEDRLKLDHKIFVRAKLSYESNHDHDMSFHRGDLLEVNKIANNDAWLNAKNLKTGKAGLIPRDYVVIDDERPSSLPGWFEISRLEAEYLLMPSGFSVGTYIIRPASDGYSLALSLKYSSNRLKSITVIHYKITKNDKDNSFSLTQKKVFQNLVDLIEYYKYNLEGIPVLLTNPCPHDYIPTVPFYDLEVARKGIKLVKKLGSGNFGDVFLAKWNNTIKVAVKILKSKTMKNNALFIDEAKMMHKLRHKNIVQLLGICLKPENEPFYLITEYMKNGSLLSFLHLFSNEKLSLSDAVYMMSQICNGMAYLEKSKVVHCDLRAANILVGDNFLCKVGDFGLTKILEENETEISVKISKFPIRWTAPEALKSHNFTIKSDVWSFGVLIFEIVTLGGKPYSGLSNDEVHSFVISGNRMQCPKSPRCPEVIYNIMNCCWDDDPNQRPKFSQLYEVFTDMNFSSDGNHLKDTENDT